MSSVTETIEVAAPVRAAYNQWTQFEDFPQFMSGVQRIEQLDDTHNRWFVKVGGVERQFDTEITEQRPDELIAWTSTDGTLHSGMITFEPLDAGATAVTVQIGWKPEGFVEKVGDLVGADDRQVHADLDRFKTFLEQRGAETGGWRDQVRPEPGAGAMLGTGALAAVDDDADLVDDGAEPGADPIIRTAADVDIDGPGHDSVGLEDRRI